MGVCTQGTTHETPCSLVNVIVQMMGQTLKCNASKLEVIKYILYFWWWL